MIEVAKGLDAPILLMWPRSLLPGARSGFSMLGLGDIVIPGQFTPPLESQDRAYRVYHSFPTSVTNSGSFIATCLRFDLFRSQRTHELTKTHSSLTFQKPYFKASLIAYIIALNITSLMMQMLDRAQPALLYLR